MEWKKISCFGQVPKKRRRTSVCTYNNKLYFYGGYSTVPLPTFLSDFVEFDPLTSKWTRISTNSTPQGRSGHTIISYKNCIYLFAGASTFFRDHDEIWEYNFDKKEWKELKPKGKRPSPRQFHSTCLYDDNMVIYGGYFSREIALNDLHLYSITKNEWNTIPFDQQIGVPPEPITDHVIFCDETHLYVFGGAIGNETVRNSADNVHCFNFITNTWSIIISEEKVPNFPQRMSCLSGVKLKDKFYVFGGYDDDNDICSDEFHSFDLITHNWNKIETKLSPEKRLKHSMGCIGNDIYIFGGLSDTSENLNDLHVIQVLKKNIQNDLFLNVKEQNFCDLVIMGDC
eukprot:gene8508-332_t